MDTSLLGTEPAIQTVQVLLEETMELREEKKRKTKGGGEIKRAEKKKKKKKEKEFKL
jgi:hypothetical protein